MAMNLICTLILIQINFLIITSIKYSCVSNSACGCSLNSVILTRIIGGEQAQANTWGWVVSIRLRNLHLCGGTLISSNLILTAAHCLVSIETISSLSITAGSTYLSEINQQRSISEVYIHRNYQPSTYTNDIALLRLSSPLNMNDDSISLICLSPNITEFLTNNTTVVAIGWGVLSTKDKTSSNTLQQVSLKLFDNMDSICQRSIRNEYVQLCAGVENGGKDTCQGDSGGPLMTFYNEQWYIIGITSYGISCGLPKYAGIYTRVLFYEQWIDCFLKNDTICVTKMFTVKSSVPSLIASFYINCILFLWIIHF